MTSPLIRGRPRRATAHISVRVLHTVVGGLAAVVWLVLPWMTINSDVPVPAARAHPAAASAAAPEQTGTSAADLVLPLVAAGAVVVVAGYGYVRRTRRARTRTTPGGGVAPAGPAAAPLSELDERVRALLARADDWVRTSREELDFAEARSGADSVAPFVRAVRDSEAELSAAFRMRQQYDDGIPEDEAARRHALAGMIGRCQEAGRRLDAEAAGFDLLRALETAEGLGEALEVAEDRFRALAARAGGAGATLAALARRYGSAAVDAVTGHAEQAKDRLVFATTRLNQARQAADMGEAADAARHLRAAEGATAQAGVFVAGIERLAADLASAAELVPAALTGAEAELAGARTGAGDAGDVPAGELHARAAHADLVLTAVRAELTAGPYDPLDALRLLVRGLLPVGVGRAGVLSAAASLVARSAVAEADAFVTTHRGAVGSTARTRLAEAKRLLTEEPPDLLTADALARRAHELAERDVRLHGNPITGTAEHETGTAGAVTGGVLLGTTPQPAPPTAFGGPRTRTRRAERGSPD
ncbi:hypothetical protein AB0N07_28630 [Streptomyces sp. NPDC051172]|uniref:hypothetical protein n=1 Tax=Streptomyces sp. NPDC051172 TaxID=3155796 RepID=UPI00342393A9